MSTQERLFSTRQLFSQYLRQMHHFGVDRFFWTLPEPKPGGSAFFATAGQVDSATRESKQAALGALKPTVLTCTKCPLHTRRTNGVFGQGNPAADLVFVGEAPGYYEDKKGEPFVGRAGDLLTKIIGAMKLTREDIYICNVIKCRPPENRDPNTEEIASCEPYLIEQLNIIQPKVICAMGRFATQTLLKNTAPVSRQRGQWKEYQGIPLMPTFHPAYLLRNPEDKRLVWKDMQEIMKLLGIPV